MRQSGSELIAQKRIEQVTKHGHSNEIDDKQTDEMLATRAAVYAMPQQMKHEVEAWEYLESEASEYDDRIDELATAGGLIAAEIDRLVRLEERNNKGL